MLLVPECTGFVRRMPRNVEIKARVHDICKIKKLAKELSKSEAKLIEQQDTFFNAPNGRLKLRELKVCDELLIFRIKLKSCAADFIFAPY